MGNILSRIQEIASNEGITIGSLERKIGASKGVLSRAIANGTDIQSKWLQILVENYPEYSTLWLMTGKGPMLEKDPSRTQEATQTKPKATRSTPTSEATESVLLSLIREKDETIRQQAIEIGKLTEQLRSLKSQD